MKDIVPRLRSWEQQGKRYALATLIKVDRSAPKPPGAAMAVCEDGSVAGSVSGGCVESALHTEAADVLASGVPKQVSYGISDAEGFEIGLACGGQLHLFVDRPTFPSGLFEAVEANQPVAIATIVSGPNVGGRLILRPEAPGAPAQDSPTAPKSVMAGLDAPAFPAIAPATSGGFGDAGFRNAVAADAKLLWAKQTSEVRTYEQGDVFIQTFAPAAEMYVFGAADFSAAVASIGKFLGFHVTVVDPRSVFATKERFPSADQIVVEWPDKFLASAPIGPSTAIVVLTHDPKFDLPALTCAVKTDAGYIGAMGAKRTNEERFRKLREAGCTDEQLARIHAPIGLDIGGKSPEETAVAIAAEIIAFKNGKAPR
jgi:xanthine dehydrogenase accessory factor